MRQFKTGRSGNTNCGGKLATLIALGLSCLQPFVHAQTPDWSVNPASFQGSMTITAFVAVNDQESIDPDNVVGAFVGEEVRGVATPIESSGRQLYFITVYGRQDGEEVRLRVYLVQPDLVVETEAPVTFATNGILGSSTDPFVVNVDLSSSCSSGRPQWKVNPPDFESTMNVTAVIWQGSETATNEGDLLAAFSGDQLRGVVGPTEVSGDKVYFLTVYANTNGDVISFRYYNEEADQVQSVADPMTFVSNTLHGSPSAPVIMDAKCSFVPTDVENEAPELSPVRNLVIYPNPFRARTKVEFVLSQPGPVHFEVVDINGRLVRQRFLGEMSPGGHSTVFDPQELPAGAYLYRIRSGIWTVSKTMILLP